jgi:hypothetical protein
MNKPQCPYDSVDVAIEEFSSENGDTILLRGSDGFKTTLSAASVKLSIDQQLKRIAMIRVSTPDREIHPQVAQMSLDKEYIRIDIVPKDSETVRCTIYSSMVVNHMVDDFVDFHTYVWFTDRKDKEQENGSETSQQDIS